MKKTIVMLFLLYISFSAIASGGSNSHNEAHIPLDKIGWQALNLGLLLCGIFFFIRKSIVETFENRQKNYNEQSMKTKLALQNAESQLSDVRNKLASLEEGEKQSLIKAKHEAELLKANLIKDAELLAEKMKKDVTLIIENESYKAKREINQLILDKAIETTKQNLTEKNQISSTQEVAFIKQLEQVKA